MKDLLCVDGLDDVDSVYARRQSVMIGFNVELAKSTHHPSEKSKRSSDGREAPALLDKKTAASCDAAVLKFLLQYVNL